MNQENNKEKKTDNPENQLQKKLTIYSSAKLNLYLNVGHLQADDYHSLQTVLQTIDLYDKLEFTLKTELKNPKEQITIEVTKTEQSDLLKETKANLIYRAAKLFFQTLKKNKNILEDVGLEVKLTKNIPIAAGLAGGSGNAAATLYALNHLLNEPFTQAELLNLAKELGSDVPYCLIGGCMMGTGRGDQLTRIGGVDDLIFVLVLPPPDVTLQTKDVYKNFDTLNESQHKATPTSIEKFIQLLLSTGKNCSKHMFNSLEESAISLSYWVDKAKNAIDSHGYYSLVSGSGPTVFTIAPNEFQAINLVQKLQEDGLQAKCYRSTKESFLIVSG